MPAHLTLSHVAEPSGDIDLSALTPPNNEYWGADWIFDRGTYQPRKVNGGDIVQVDHVTDADFNKNSNAYLSVSYDTADIDNHHEALVGRVSGDTNCVVFNITAPGTMRTWTIPADKNARVMTSIGKNEGGGTYQVEAEVSDGSTAMQTLVLPSNAPSCWKCSFASHERTGATVTIRLKKTAPSGVTFYFHKCVYMPRPTLAPKVGHFSAGYALQGGFGPRRGR